MVTVPLDTKELCTVCTTVNCTAGHLGAGSMARVYVKVSKCIYFKKKKNPNSKQTGGSDTRKKITPKFTEPVMLLASQEITLL